MTETNPKLPKKDIPLKDRLIVALDVDSCEEARKLVDLLGDAVTFYKLGLQLFMSGNYFELVTELTRRDKKVFVDLKFFDVPETVRSAVRQLKGRGATFVTVHGNDAILKAAAEEKNGLKILAVTVLTSLDEGDLKDLGFKTDVKALVLSRAKRALQLNCDGVISSGLEANELRDFLGNGFLIVSPGIRPVENRSDDDQKRVASPTEAFRNGADYIVMGRPIREAPDPRAEAEKIQAEIEEVFNEMNPELGP